MVRFFRVLSLLALAFFCQPTTTQASLVKIDFSGTLSQLTAGGCFICGPYTATVTFNTEDGLFQQTGPDSYSFSTIDPGYISVGFSNGIGVTGDGFVDWAPGFLTGNIGSMFSHVSFISGYVQYGTCGTRCASLNVSSVSVSEVPSPIIGAGLPGLLMAIAGFIGWRRSRYSFGWKAWKH
jgi:hypothetical protein